MSALYRKYRPRDLSQVVGQEPVVRTLGNAIANDRVRHAYLFAGPRGTGKTSLAKILAKSLNCLASDRPTTTPCGVCESCRAIHDATALDVVELDAASNRGIDDIREIRDRVAVAPAISRRKVYILDEAHSLTTDASNALLKTLEEPPEHIVFVLCTTEPQRLLDTIKGRCQAFAFTRPTVDEIRVVLRRIAEAEGIRIDDDALALVARAGRGSFRDAVSTLDQLATACAGEITPAGARALLGTVEFGTLAALVDLVADRDAPGCLRLVDRLVEAGQDLGQLVVDLLAHLRVLFLTRELGEPPASAPIGGEDRAAAIAQAGRLDERSIVHFIDGLLAVQEELRDGGDPRLPLELLLVKLARPSSERSLEAVLRRLDALERGPAPVAPAPVSTPPAPPAASEPVPAAAPTPPSAPVGNGNGRGHDEAELARIWRSEVLPAVAARRPALAPSLDGGRPVGISGGALHLAYTTADSFSRSKVDTDTSRALIADVLSEVFGTRLRIVFEVADETAAPVPPAAPAATPAADDDAASADAWIHGMKTELDAHEVEETT